MLMLTVTIASKSVIFRPHRIHAVCCYICSTFRGTGVDKGAQGAQPPPQWPGKKIFFVKIKGLLEPVVLNLSFRVRSNAMFTSERRY